MGEKNNFKNSGGTWPKGGVEKFRGEATLREALQFILNFTTDIKEYTDGSANNSLARAAFRNVPE